MSDISSNLRETPRQVRSFTWFVRRGLIDTGIAIAALIIFAIVFAFSVATHTTAIGLHWLLPVCWTGFLCFVIVKVLKQERKNPVMWLMLALLVALHLVALRPIVQRFPNMHSATYMLIAFAEVPVWGLLVQGAIGLSGKRIKRHTKRRLSVPK